MVARLHNRRPNQLRPLAAEPGALSRADGAARFAHGTTEVLAAVYGPTEARRARERINEACIEVVVRPPAGMPGPMEREMEQLIGQTLQHLVLTTFHPRAAISVVVQVLADDGALLSAVLHAVEPLNGLNLSIS